MIPTDYRFEQVVVRLIERLEATRPTYAGSPEKQGAEFRRITSEHVEAAIAEFKDVAFSAEPEAHAKFLRREALETFLPRYSRMATEMTAVEESHFGLGPIAGPIGRLALVGVMLGFLYFLMRFVHSPMGLPLMFFGMSLPFWPDIISGLSRRKYNKTLQALVDDMERIQEQQGAYVTFGDPQLSEAPVPTSTATPASSATPAAASASTSQEQEAAKRAKQFSTKQGSA